MNIRAIAIAGAIVLVATACGSDDDSAATTTAATETSAAASTSSSAAPDTTAATETTAAAETTAPAGDFPVTITHTFGDTVIEEQPERVVTIGYTDGDDVLALGVTPVAIRDWYGDQPGGLWPWAVEAEAAGGADIEVLSSAEIPFEQIASLQPDVIIGVSSEIEQADYDKLKEIAPTIGPAADYIQFGTPWDVQQLMIGQALGLEDEAQAIVDDINDQIATIVEENPSWTGMTGNVSAIGPDGTSYLYTPEDARGRLLTSLGFVIPEEVIELAGDLFYATAGPESIDLNDGDLLLYTTFSPDDRAAVDASPLFQALEVVQNGQAVYLDQALTGAMSFGTTLSIPYFLDAAVPQIQTALGDGDGTGDTPSVGGIVPGEDPDVDAVVEAYLTVFDSSTSYAEKEPLLENAADVKATVDNYGTAADVVGGIALVPTAVTIDGDTAAVTYDVLFAGTVVYGGLEGDAINVDGVWQVPQAKFCEFMAQAMNPCP